MSRPIINKKHPQSFITSETCPTPVHLAPDHEKRQCQIISGCQINYLNNTNKTANPLHNARFDASAFILNGSDKTPYHSVSKLTCL
jgi:hypothetical protein